MIITRVEPIILRSSILVRVHTDEGLTGIGECSLMDARVIAAHIEHSLAPLVVGGDPTRIEWLLKKALGGTYKVAGQTQAMAMSGIEMLARAGWSRTGYHAG